MNNSKTNLNNLPYLSLSLCKIFIAVFFIMAFGKFYYYVYGWSGHLNPSAPTYIIVLKDVVFISFIWLFIVNQLVKGTISVKKFTGEFITVLMFGVILSLPHIYNIGIFDWAQHFIRNSLLYLFIIYFAYKLIPVSKYEIVFKCIIIIGIINALIAIHSQIFSYNLFFGRSLSFTDNPNTLGGVLCISLLISYLYVLNYKKRLYYLVIALLVLALLSTISITYIALTAIFMFFFSVKRKKHFLIFTLFAFFLLLFFINNYETVLPLINRLDDIFSEGSINTVDARVGNYQNMSMYFQDAGIIQMLFGDYLTEGYKKFDSAYLVIIRNFGLVYFLVLLICVNGTIIRGFNISRKLEDKNIKFYFTVLISGCLLFMFSGLVRNVFNRFPLNIIFYVQFGMLIRLIKESVLTKPLIESSGDKN